MVVCFIHILDAVLAHKTKVDIFAGILFGRTPVGGAPAQIYQVACNPSSA